MPVMPQLSFTGGELAPSVYARTDLQKYMVGLKTGLNVFVHAHGGASNRAGFEFLYRTKVDADRARLIPFQFNVEQTYALEFGDQYMRVWRDGGLVLESAQNIVSVTIATDTIEITGHGWSNGDWVYASGIVGTLSTILNGKYFKVAGAATDTFTLTDIDGTAIDFAGLAYTSGGNFARVYTLSTPYVEADLPMLKYTQSADTMTIVCNGYDPRNLTRAGHASWSLTSITYAPSISAPATCSASGGTAGSFDFTYRVTAVDESTGEESLAKESTPLASKDKPTTTGSTNIVVTWAAVSGASKYNIYRSDGNATGGIGSVFGYVGSADGSATTFRDWITNPAFDDTSPSTTATTPFSGASDKPGCVMYHQQRLLYGNTVNNPQLIQASQIGNYTNMNASEPTKADDAFSMTIASAQVNQIRHFVSLDDVIILTSGGEFIMRGGEDGVLTPATVQIKPQTYYGCSDVPPIIVGNTILFVQERGSIVRDLGYTLEADGYAGNDLSILSNHLFEGYEIVEWCYSQQPYSIIWAVRDDGVLLSLTYQREHQVWAWTRHTTAGKFESVCCIKEGSEDVVYAIIRRKIGGTWKRYVERLHTRYFADIRDAFFVDSGLSYDPALAIESITLGVSDITIGITGHGYADGDQIDLSDIVAEEPGDGETSLENLNNVRFTVSDSAANSFKLKDRYGNSYVSPTGLTAYESGGYARVCIQTVTGLDHLEGRTVSALNTGNVERDLVVTDGSVTLKAPGSRIHIGLPYTADMETLDIDFSSNEGSSFGRKKSVSEVVVKVQKTRGMMCGPSFAKLKEFKQRNPGYETPLDPIAPRTGEMGIAVESSWKTNGRVCIRQEDPLPMTVQAIVPEVTIGS
jgi:hypothetical protein